MERYACCRGHVVIPCKWLSLSIIASFKTAKTDLENVISQDFCDLYRFQRLLRSWRRSFSINVDAHQ